jgi:hypothetical protein
MQNQQIMVGSGETVGDNMGDSPTLSPTSQPLPHGSPKTDYNTEGIVRQIKPLAQSLQDLTGF